jgi:hypothetical protein
MAIVKAKKTRKPMLEVLADGKFHPDHEIQEKVAKKLRVTPAERKVLLASDTPVTRPVSRTERPGASCTFRIPASSRPRSTAAGRRALRTGAFYAS